MLTISPSGISRIENLAHDTDDCISLSQGAIRIDGIPKAIKQHLASLLSTTQADYYLNPSLKRTLQHTVSSWISQKYGCSIDPALIIPTHGCMGALSILFLTLLDQGNEVIIPQPAYPLYEHITHIAKAVPIFASYYTNDSNNLWSWDRMFENIQKARSPKTKILVLSNPMNPTGMVINPRQLKALLSWCETHGIYLIVDEVYEDYVFTDFYQTIAHHIQHSPWAIRVSSLSKSYAMSGWRIGHAIVPKHLVSCLERVQHSLLVCPSVLGMWAGIYAYKHPELIAPYQKEITHNVKLVHQKIAAFRKDKQISYTIPDGGFNYFIKLKEGPMNEYCLRLIRQAKVSLVPGESFGPDGSGFVRLCYARSRNIVEDGVNRLINHWVHDVEFTKDNN